MIGVGSDNSRGTFDNVRVLVLPPAITFQSTDTFDDGVADLFPSTLQTGAWVVQGGRLTGSPAGGGIATSLIDLGIDGLEVSSYLELVATVKRDVPLETGIEELKLTGFNLEKSRALFTELEFTNLITLIENGG